MRVSQLGGDVEAEVGSVLDRGVAKPDARAPALLEGLLQQERLQNRVQFFAHIFQQHWRRKNSPSFLKYRL